MKRLLLILLLTGSVLADNKQSNLIIVDPGTFYAGNFWETPAGQAFWETPEGKAVLKTMLEYQTKIETQEKS